MHIPYRLVGSFKGALFIGGVVVIFVVVLYTNSIVNGLREHSRRYVTLKVERFRNLFMQGDEALDVYLREMATKDFPLIVANAHHEPTSWSGLPRLEELPDSTAYKRAAKLMKEWVSQGNEPIPIEISEFGLILYFYYGDSDQIRRLRNLPWIMIALAGVLVLIGYVGFVNIKKSEQRFVWVGMARETAHQMGTPLTSLMGWVELLSEKGREDDELATIKNEMQSDIERLSTVAERFNRIGSRPRPEKREIYPVVESAVSYIQRRLPQISTGEVKIGIDMPQDLTAKINPDLFSWVIENLLRNGVEALHGSGGTIKVKGFRYGRKSIIDVEDSGAGIQRYQWRNIFRPGYSTKKRGWGLGLSLARRIVEDMHKGKIFVQESKIGKGTTIRIVVPG